MESVGFCYFEYKRHTNLAALKTVFLCPEPARICCRVGGLPQIDQEADSIPEVRGSAVPRSQVYHPRNQSASDVELFTILHR